jgi:hypothetical protein
MEVTAMKHHQYDGEAIKLLDTCIRSAQQLLALISEQHKDGRVTTEGLKCLTDALASLCRCQDYFKPDGDY